MELVLDLHLDEAARQGLVLLHLGEVGRRRDPRRGAGEERARALALLAAEYDAFARERHPKLLAYARSLERLGYRVTGVPDLRIDQRHNIFGTVNTDFGYANILPGLSRGEPSVHRLPFGIAPLDGAAEAAFRAAGVRPVRLARGGLLANALMQCGGGLRCACAPLE